MASGQRIIELNGKRYDASTGKAVDTARPVAAKPTASGQTTKRPAISPETKLVDGVRAPRKSLAVPKIGRAPEHSKTLMRHAVQKPVVVKADKHTTSKAPKHTHDIAAQDIGRSQSIKPERLLRAATVHKSTLISKFGRPKNFGRTDVVPVKPAPAHAPAANATQPAAAISKASSPIDQISAALEQANGHLQPKLKKQSAYHRIAKRLHLSPAILAGGTIGLVVLVVGGWLALNNVPNIAMRIAATRAGIHATMPTYHPSGFGLEQPINYSAGEVSLKFASNSDKRSFSIIQKASTWDSQALLDNVVGKQAYQAIQSSGRTIYIYSNNATWVDGGTWYQVKGDASLSSDQLLKIANGL